MLKIIPKIKKTFQIILTVLSYVIFFVCLFLIVFTITVKKDADGAISFFNRQVRVVVSDSMTKNERTDVSNYRVKDIPVKSMIFIELVPEDEMERKQWYSDLQVGDVVTFKYYYTSSLTITHRITSIIEKEGGYLIVLKGDNEGTGFNSLEQIIDTTRDDGENYIVGRVTGQSYFLGAVVVALKSPVTVICLIIIPCLAITCIEIMRLVTVIKSK